MKRLKLLDGFIVIVLGVFRNRLCKNGKVYRETNSMERNTDQQLNDEEILMETLNDSEKTTIFALQDAVTPRAKSGGPLT